MDLGELKARMDSSPSEKRADTIPFRVERSEVNINLRFAQPFWPLANNITPVYAALLNRMRDFGVTLQALRTERGDGSLSAFEVNFWMLQFSVIVRIRLDAVELNATPVPADVNLFERAFLAMDQSLRDVEPTVSYSGIAVTTTMHGRLEGAEVPRFVSSFAGKPPEGLGKLVGSGTAFYFEGPAPTTLLTVTVDMSAALAGGLFVKVHSVFDTSMRPEGLRATADRQLEQSIAALGLRVPEK